MCKMYKSLMGKFIGLFKIVMMVLVMVGSGEKGWGQTLITAGATNYIQNFDVLTGVAGTTWTDGATLTGWYAKTDLTASITTYAPNTGSSTAGSLYAFAVAGTNPITDKALGFAPSNAFTGASGVGKGYIGWRLKNNTSSTITSISVTWTGEQWRRENNATAHTLNLFYQTGVTVTNLTAGSWTSSASIFTSPTVGATPATVLDGNAPVNRTVGITANIVVNVAVGEEIMLRWEDLNDVGTDHLLALDDVIINATLLPACVTPTLISASQAASICSSTSATISMTGLVASSINNTINYTINGVVQTAVTGVNADVLGNASFTTSTLTTANNGQILQITGITNGVCNTAFTQNVTLAVIPLPATPMPPTVTGTNPSCGATALNIMVPPGGETYYWQGTTALGTSTTSTTATTYPVGTTGTYYMRSQNNTTFCWSTPSSLLVTINTLPAAVILNPTTATICNGASVTLNATSNLTGSATVGTQTANSLAANTPYRQTSTTEAKMQYLITKAELNAAGIIAAADFNSLAFNVTALGTGTMTTYNIGMANTSATVLTTTFQTAVFTAVYNGINFLPVLGVNTHNFSTPFSWDGTSNILINICHSGPNGTASTVSVLTPTAISTTTLSGIGSCAITTNAFVVTNSNRPIITFGYTSQYPITWSPSTGLNTTIGNSVTASPTTTTPYIATATNSFGCKTNNTVNITVSPNITPTFTAVAPICNGGSLSALPTTSNNGITGTWSPALDNSTTTLYTFTPTSGQCATITTLTIVVNSAGSWLGLLSSNWFDANNWACGGGVPLAGTNVTIPTGAPNYPIITTGTALVNNITIYAGASVTVNGAGVFTLYGTIANAGTFDVTAGTLNMSGIVPQILGGASLASNSVKNLIISNNTDLSSEVKVTTGLTFGSTGKTLTTAGNLTIVSNASGTAYVGNTTGNTITGMASIERYLDGIKSWRYLATPVVIGTSPTITESWREGGASLLSTGYGVRITGPDFAGPVGALTLDQYTLRPSMKSYDAVTGSYIGITQTDLFNNKLIANDEGYAVFVNGDRAIAASTGPLGFGPTTLRIKGVIRTGSQTFTITPAVVAGAGGGFLSVGNPYPSQMDFTTVTKNTVAETFYVWNPNGGFYGVGQYENYSLDLSNPPHYTRNGSLGGTPHNFIESGQAFFIQSIVPGSIVVKEIDKTTGSNLVSRPGVTIPTLEINLHTNNANGIDFVADGVMLNFGSSYSSALDNSDVRKISNSVDNLAIKYDAKNLVVERRPNLTQTDTIKLYLTSTRIAPYRFEIDPSVLSNTGLAAFLKDKFLQTETAISLTTVTNVNFEITADAASKVADRFMIVFRQAAGGPLPIRFIDIVVAKNNDKINTVKWNVANELNIQQYEIERSEKGTNFVSIGNTTALNNIGGSHAYSFVDAMPLAQDNYYRIKAVSVSGEVQYSAIVKVLADTKAACISVYPNPVEGKKIQVSFLNKVGKYNIVLLNGEGKTIYTQNLIVSSANEVKIIDLNNDKAQGHYELVITSNEGVKQVLPIIIQ